MKKLLVLTFILLTSPLLAQQVLGLKVCGGIGGLHKSNVIFFDYGPYISQKNYSQMSGSVGGFFSSNIKRKGYVAAEFEYAEYRSKSVLQYPMNTTDLSVFDQRTTFRYIGIPVYGGIRAGRHIFYVGSSLSVTLAVRQKITPISPAGIPSVSHFTIFGRNNGFTIPMLPMELGLRGGWIVGLAPKWACELKYYHGLTRANGIHRLYAATIGLRYKLVTINE
jgi:hypothetical protein